MQFDFRTELGKIAPRIAVGAKVYVFGAGANWENICKNFKYLVNIDIDDHIEGFLDNDAAKQGTIFHGKQVFAVSDIDTDNAVILISIGTFKANLDIFRQLLPYGLYHTSSVFDVGWDYLLLMGFAYSRLLQFKGKHKGERCFIIGNGPSLSASDLDRLKNEVTFAANRIYLMYNKTAWRPSYYALVDRLALIDSYHEIAKVINCPSFYAANAIFNVDNFNLTDFYFFYPDFNFYWKPNKKASFSEEPFVMQTGGTVTYICLQLAAYMGFSEIYLLGVDNTSERVVKHNGEIIFNNAQCHFDKGYQSTQLLSYSIDVVNSSYQTALEYGESHNIKIRNATRGGELEIFERVDFDSLFK
jgi:uncharacterized Rossmann fold enzyme